MTEETQTETKQPSQDEILAEIYKDFTTTYSKAKELKHSMSLKSMHRIFDAILSFPLDESAINKVKKGTKEFELFVLALGTIRARHYINSIVEKKQDVQDALKAKLEESEQTTLTEGEDNYVNTEAIQQ